MIYISHYASYFLELIAQIRIWWSDSIEYGTFLIELPGVLQSSVLGKRKDCPVVICDSVFAMNLIHLRF